MLNTAKLGQQKGQRTPPSTSTEFNNTHFLPTPNFEKLPAESSYCKEHTLKISPQIESVQERMNEPAGTWDDTPLEDITPYTIDDNIVDIDNDLELQLPPSPPPAELTQVQNENKNASIELNLGKLEDGKIKLPPIEEIFNSR